MAVCGVEPDLGSVLTGVGWLEQDTSWRDPQERGERRDGWISGCMAVQAGCP